MAWSVALWLLVYVSALRLESYQLKTTRSKRHEPGKNIAEVTQLRNIGGDDGIDKHIVNKTKCLSTTGKMSSTVIRKQFHVIAVAVFLPGLLSDINMLRVAVGCSLVVFVMLEVCAHRMCCS